MSGPKFSSYNDPQMHFAQAIFCSVSSNLIKGPALARIGHAYKFEAPTSLAHPFFSCTVSVLLSVLIQNTSANSTFK